MRSARIPFRRFRRGWRCARPSTTFRPGSSPSSTTTLRRQGFGDRLDAVLDELQMVRAETGWPPLAAPIGQMLGSQALVHVLSAQRWQLVRGRARRTSSRARYGELPGAGRSRREARRRAARRHGSTPDDEPPGAGRDPRGARGDRRERGGAAARSALRRGGRAASARDPRRAAAATTARRPGSSAPSPSGCAT